MALSGLTRWAVGEPVIPHWVYQAVHRPEPSLPLGVTYDFLVIDPQTKRPLLSLPESGDVELRLAVTNDSALPVNFSFPTGLQCEFVARRVHTYVGGLFVLPLEVWRSSYFHNISQQRSTLVLESGQTKFYTAVWTLDAQRADELPPGDYRLSAIFNGFPIKLPMAKPQ